MPPVHDAFLIECPEPDREHAAVEIRRIMAQSGKYVLGEDTILRADARTLRYPVRLLEEKGKGSEMWNRMLATIARLSGMLPDGLGIGVLSPGSQGSFLG
jgi:hypothetical protein